MGISPLVVGLTVVAFGTSAPELAVNVTAGTKGGRGNRVDRWVPVSERAGATLRQAAVTAGLIDGPVPHRAMADTELTLECFRHFVGRLSARPPSEIPPAARPTRD